MTAEPTMRERMTRVEGQLDGMARDIGVLKDDVRVLTEDVKELKHDVAGVKQDLRSIHHRIDVVVEHVDDGFRRQAELMQVMDERHERRAADMDERHKTAMELLRDVLGNHQGRIRGLEEARGGPA